MQENSEAADQPQQAEGQSPGANPYPSTVTALSHGRLKDHAWKPDAVAEQAKPGPMGEHRARLCMVAYQGADGELRYFPEALTHSGAKRMASEMQAGGMPAAPVRILLVLPDPEKFVGPDAVHTRQAFMASRAVERSAAEGATETDPPRPSAVPSYAETYRAMTDEFARNIRAVTRRQTAEIVAKDEARKAQKRDAPEPPPHGRHFANFVTVAHQTPNGPAYYSAPLSASDAKYMSREMRAGGTPAIPVALTLAMPDPARFLNADPAHTSAFLLSREDERRMAEAFGLNADKPEAEGPADDGAGAADQIEVTVSYPAHSSDYDPRAGGEASALVVMRYLVAAQLRPLGLSLHTTRERTRTEACAEIYRGEQCVPEGLYERIGGCLCHVAINWPDADFPPGAHLSWTINIRGEEGFGYAALAQPCDTIARRKASA